MSATCGACGGAVAVRARFCPRCGESQEVALEEHRADQRRERARFRGAIAAFQWVFVLPVLGTIALYFVYLDDGVSERVLLLLHVLLLLFAGGLGVFALRPGGLKASLPLRTPPKWYASSVPVAAGMFLVGWGWVALLLLMSGDAELDPDMPVVWIVAALAVAPVLEEWLCRGVLWEACRRITGPLNTVLLTAALFAFLHGLNGGWILELPHRFAGGLLLGWLRLRSGSLLPCMLAHFLNNLAAVALA